MLRKAPMNQSLAGNFFTAVQEYRKQVCEEAGRFQTTLYPNIFKGKVFCADCGRSLHRQREKTQKGPDVYHFHCLTNSRVQQKAVKA